MTRHILLLVALACGGCGSVEDLNGAKQRWCERVPHAVECRQAAALERIADAAERCAGKN